MSAGVARLIFVFALVLNLLLWSNSRYAHKVVSESMRARDHGSLVRRISYELMHPGEMRIFEEMCYPTSQPLPLQCKHVEEECPSPSTFLSIGYLHSYFCAEQKLRPFVFIGLMTWLIFLFSFLGISASDFFSPNLASIAQMLGLDENVAGVTFLAFGNGSPDLFSTFSAMRAGSGSLAVGELLGAATFIVSCVVGSMCIIKPFRVHRAPFLRDVGFFTLAVGIVLLILYDGEIRALESGLLVVIYAIYVIIVVVGTWWENRRERIRQREALIRNEYGEDTTTAFPPYLDEPPQPSSAENGLSVAIPIPGRARATSTPEPPRLHVTLPPRPKSRTPSPGPRTAHLPSFSLVGALEFRDVVSSLQSQAAGASLNIFESHVPPYAGGLYRHRSHGPFSLSRTNSMRSQHGDEEDRYVDGCLRLDDRRSAPSSATLVPEQNESRELAGEHQESASFSNIPSIYRTSSESQEQLFTPPTKRQRMWSTGKAILYTLFPTLYHLRDQSVLGKIVSVIAAPAVMVLTLTLPVVVIKYECHHQSIEKLRIGGDAPLVAFEDEGVERVLIAEEEVEENLHRLAFNKWLMATQCILGPLFCSAVLFAGNSYEWWIILASVIAGFAVAVLVLIFAENGCHPYAKMARCSMGFLVSIVWIMAIADEVVLVLQTFGNIFGLSDAIIGLTIFAVGNSLADLVANMSVAVFAPIMGFSACFGGPMLNILLGIGISGSWLTHTAKQPYSLDLSPTLLVSTVGLLVLLAATLIFVPLNGYYLTRRWGILLVLLYVVIMGFNLFVEIRHLK